MSQLVMHARPVNLYIIFMQCYNHSCNESKIIIKAYDQTEFTYTVRYRMEVQKASKNMSG